MCGNDELPIYRMGQPPKRAAASRLSTDFATNTAAGARSVTANGNAFSSATGLFELIHRHVAEPRQGRRAWRPDRHPSQEKLRQLPPGTGSEAAQSKVLAVDFDATRVRGFRSKQ